MLVICGKAGRLHILARGRLVPVKVPVKVPFWIMAHSSDPAAADTQDKT